MEGNNSETICDTLSERELQRIARLEMTTALDNYWKRKRVTLEQVSCSVASVGSVSTNKGSESKSEEHITLQETLKTYDEALSSVSVIVASDS